MQKKGSHATYSQAEHRIYHSSPHKLWRSRRIAIQTSCSKDDQGNIQARETTHQVKWYTLVNPCMWGEQNNHGKIRMTMLSKARWSINIISMSMYSTNMAMKHREKGYLRILYQYESIIIISMSNISNKYNNQTCIQWYQGLSTCNQEIGTHWSTHQTPHLLHLKFKLDPLMIPSGVAILWTPHFVLMRFPLDGELDFFILKNDLIG